MINQFNTKNVSLLKLCDVLKEEGIKDNGFFLTLIDEDLTNVDPHDPQLSPKNKKKVIIECMNNPWYFLREVVRWPSPDGSAIIPEFNRGNLAVSWCILHNIDNYSNICRGFFTRAAILSTLLYIQLFEPNNYPISFVNKQKQDAVEDLNTMLLIKDKLPDYINKVFNFDSYTNTRVYPGPNSIDGAGNIGRGLTTPFQLLNGYEFIKFGKKIVDSSKPSYVSAKRHNKRHCQILTSVKSRKDIKNVQENKLLISECCEWTDKMYDMDLVLVDNYVYKNSLDNMVYIKFDYKQLGQTDEWFYDMCRLLNHDEEAIKNELLLED